MEAGMAEGAGFLGRWSRRKLDAKEGRPLDEPPPASRPAPAALPEHSARALQPVPEQPTPAAVAPSEAAEAPPPALTLEDTQGLTPASDFKPFMGRNVAPDVKNAAMKKLFADPHFNVMDGLDTYIDDYSKPDPMPATMLRQLASAKFLKMFDEEEKEEDGAHQKPLEHRDDADAPLTLAVAQSDLCNTFPSPPDSPPLSASQNPDAHTDLRLQPDDAIAGREPGRRPE
jgi:hypothetical protein